MWPKVVLANEILTFPLVDYKEELFPSLLGCKIGGTSGGEKIQIAELSFSHVSQDKRSGNSQRFLCFQLSFFKKVLERVNQHRDCVVEEIMKEIQKRKTL